MLTCSLLSAVLLCSALEEEPPSDKYGQVAKTFAHGFYDKYEFAALDALLSKDVKKLKGQDEDGRAYIKRNGPMLAQVGARTVSVVRMNDGQLADWLLRVRTALPDYYRRDIPDDSDEEILIDRATKTWPHLISEINAGGIAFCIVGESKNGFRGGIIIVIRELNGKHRITLVDDR